MNENNAPILPIFILPDDPNKPMPDPTIQPPYFILREREYPPMADYLDGVVKGDQAQIDKYIADCLAVKAKYPKPTE